MLQTALEHPQKLYPIIFGLFVLLIVLYLQKLGERKQNDIHTRSEYLGTGLHQATMSETIEDVAKAVITEFPTFDDAQQARMVRDKLKLQGLKNVDLYEAAIYATITRLKGGAHVA